MCTYGGGDISKWRCFCPWTTDTESSNTFSREYCAYCTAESGKLLSIVSGKTFGDGGCEFLRPRSGAVSSGSLWVSSIWNVEHAGHGSFSTSTTY